MTVSGGGTTQTITVPVPDTVLLGVTSIKVVRRTVIAGKASNFESGELRLLASNAPTGTALPDLRPDGYAFIAQPQTNEISVINTKATIDYPIRSLASPQLS